MNLKRILGIILIVGALFLNSCSVQTKEIGFGGGKWSIPNRPNDALVQKHTDVDAVVKNANLSSNEKDSNIVQIVQCKAKMGQLFATKYIATKSISNPVRNKITKLKIGETSRLVSTKEMGKSMGWASLVAGLLATLFQGAVVLSILLAICGVIFGYIGLKIRPGFIGRLLCYAGIAISILSVFSGIIDKLVTLLFLIALILLLLLILKKA